MKKHTFFKIIAFISLLLCIPLMAMQFTKQVNWTMLDFAAMAALLLMLGVACEFIVRKTLNMKHRVAMLSATMFVFLLIWIELAVGIF